jgi:ribose 5-phosphate isomerase A
MVNSLLRNYEVMYTNNFIEKPVVNFMSDPKDVAGKAAVDLVKNNARIGLGSGSTVAFFLKHLAEKCKEGLCIQGVASSVKTEQIAVDLGIPLLEEGLTGPLDITVDGADEVDPEKRLIKGGGGALLREKMLAYHSRELIVIIDESKLSERLGKSKLPVEIVTFGHAATIKKIEGLGVKAALRVQEEVPYITDNGNFIVDLDLKDLPIHIQLLDDILRKIPGVVETGFFAGLARTVLVGHTDGSVTKL